VRAKAGLIMRRPDPAAEIIIAISLLV